jgi:membrane protein YdbS with pleckstrin-like domain
LENLFKVISVKLASVKHCNTNNTAQTKNQVSAINTQAWSLSIAINVLIYLIANKSYFQTQTNNLAWLSEAMLWLFGFVITGYIIQIYFKKFVDATQTSMSNEGYLFSVRITTLLARFIYIGLMYFLAYKFFLL